MLCDNGSVKNFSSKLGGINRLSEAEPSRWEAARKIQPLTGPRGGTVCGAASAVNR